jgi:energy-coupling factor transporter ATP-binding protein EcfA2
MPLFQVPLKLTGNNEAERINKFEFGNKPNITHKEKVILVVGATGAGKSTLINGLLNYVLGVEWEEKIRFRLVEESCLFHDQHKSQTRAVTIYTLHHHPVFKVPYTVTIIDTPGFGDTEGINKDKLITKSITHLFSKEEYGIDHVDGIGFVAQSSLARLTPTQRYIFDSILSLFGKDIGENIFLLLTFSDSQKPPVLASIKEAMIPFKSYFKFNNSALFAKNDTEDNDFDMMFWNMGAMSFKKFLGQLSSIEGKSLYLTKEVLEERQQLEVYITGIQQEIRNGLTKLEQYRVELEVVKHHEADIERNKNFSYTVEEVKMVKEDLEPGKYVTNCMTCNRTCHYPCIYANDDDKIKCWAMDSDGNCTVCPMNCIWNLHRNVPYKIETEMVQVTKTADDLKKRYEEAKGEKMNAEKLTEEIMQDFYNLEMKVMYMVTEVRRSLQRLSEIALRPNPLSTVQYLDILIESEKSEARPGFQARINQLENVKAQAVTMNEISADGYDPFVEYRETMMQAKRPQDRPSFKTFAENIKKKQPNAAQKMLKKVKGLFNPNQDSK